MMNFNAYIDAATMSMVFAAVAGAAVTIGAVIAVYLRRVKHKVSEKLGIDENRNKEVEGELTGGFGESADVMTAETNKEEN
ncbi:MAG: hypothetical protein E7566_01575 [Ruminococcaceae bacterium]|nr:hypothetical protein [Oscillospiraceae bacterium]